MSHPPVSQGTSLPTLCSQSNAIFPVILPWHVSCRAVPDPGGIMRRSQFETQFERDIVKCLEFFVGSSVVFAESSVAMLGLWLYAG